MPVDSGRLLQRALFWHATAATTVACLVVLLTGSRPASASSLVLITSLALLAELWPVSIFRRGLRITFTLPYIVGIAVLAGPAVALATDVFVSGIAALSMRYASKQPVQPVWAGINLSIAAISSGLGGLAFYALGGPNLKVSWMLILAVLAFVVTYSAVNFILVAIVDRLITRRNIGDHLHQSFSIAVQTVTMYFMVSVLVALLVAAGLAVLAVLTILPIAALRHAMIVSSRLNEHYYESITALSLMLQRAHPYTLGHLKRVASIAEEVGVRLGFNARRARLLREAAVLHDIGKIAIDEDILDKPGRLTDEEFAHVKQHAEFGARILAPVESFQPMAKWIRHHHERPDGTGYPDQLSDSEIPMESKIIAVVDAFDAMTGGANPKEQRSYRQPMSMAEAIEELERCANKQFDAKVVATFKDVILGGAR